MRRWAETAAAVAATTRTSEKTRRIADYLRTLPPADLPVACVFLTGRPFAATDPRTTGVGWVAARDAVERAAGTGAGSLSRAYDRSSDPGRATFDLLSERDARRAAALGAGTTGDPEAEAVAAAHPGAPSLADVAGVFASIVRARTQARRADLLAALLDRCDPLSGMYVIKVLSGELRIGLREGYVEAAIAEAFDRPLAAVQRAHMLTGDVGETAVLARSDELATARPELFRPLRPMLASPSKDAEEIVRRVGAPAWAEDKYDGIRAQLHREGPRVRLFSRDLHDVSGQFPEVVEAARDLPWDGILDGELLAMHDGRILSFARLQNRLNRKNPDAATVRAVPAGYVVFDVLMLGPRSGEKDAGTPAAPEDAAGEPPSRARPIGAVSSVGAADPDDEAPGVGLGAVPPEVLASGAVPQRADLEPLLEVPLEERRRRLEALSLPADRFALATLVHVESAEALDAAFVDARARGNEGLVVKDPASGYTPGRRGLSWLKLKKALATLDCVVVGVEVGHGKRHGVLSDYTFAVRDDRPGAADRARARAGDGAAVAGGLPLVTVGKAYSGLTDLELADLTRWFEAHTLRHLGRYRVVEPLIVVEVAFDRIQPSARHGSGLAMRFPRIVRLRPDKTPDEADTLSAAAALVAE